jgi:hypothetical protein
MRSELEATKQDCEGMLKVMESMEKQLNQYSAREDAVALVTLMINLNYYIGLIDVFSSWKLNAKKK